MRKLIVTATKAYTARLERAWRTRRAVVLWALVLCLATLLFAAPTIAYAGTAHADADTNTEPDCNQCHKPHVAQAERSLLDGATESAVCYVCHGDAGGSAWNVETWAANSFDVSMNSGHSLEDSIDPDATVDLTNSCSGCHGVHGDPDTRLNLPANEEVAGAAFDPADPQAWCLACHNADHAWYAGSETAGVFSVDAGLKSAYEALIQDPERLSANGYYPTAGTFPGSASNTAYLSSTHAGIPAATVQSSVSTTDTASRVAGDCMWCHASHRSTATYDGLLAEYRPSTDNDKFGGSTAGKYAQACFECHGRSSGTVYLPNTTYTNTYWKDIAGAADIYALVIDSTNPDRTGHQIKSSSAFYPVGSPLPCYECHNPHGSKNGNAVMISDALGGNLNPKGTAAQVRQFCFSCHTTGDTTKGWDSGTSAYAVISAGTKVIGIDRTFSPTDPTPGWLQLSNKSYHGEANGTSCLACHDSTHNPGPGVSKGGKDCYLCHGTYQQYMEDNQDVDGTDGENVVGSASRTTIYHHVMGSGTYDGDEAVDNATYQDSGNFTDYPAAGTDVYCLSCHVDHDKFNSSKSSSLRDTIAGTDTAPGSVTAASSDFNTDPTKGGVCLGCHYLSRTKDTTNQKSDGTSVTPAIPDTTPNGLSDAITAYDNSPHQYGVTGRARGDNTTFSGDCSKCHNDSIAGSYYGASTTAPDREFGLHYDGTRRILTALGRTGLSDPYAEERFCYSCHSPASAAFKTTGGADWYGTSGIMPNTASENVYTQFTGAGYTAKHTLTLSNSAHKPASTDEVTSNRLSTAEHVECTDCHSPHAARSTTVSGTDRANPATATGNAIAAASPLSGVWGVQPPATAAWSEPTLTGYTIQSPATKEYQICLKCHSGFNNSYASATRTFSWASATGWTNQAFEFNTANASFHPVMGVATRPVAAARMLAPWNTNVGNQTMYCTDCHMDNAASPLAQGPHGSANAWILRGTWNPTVDTIDSTLGSATFLCRKCHVITDTHPAHQNTFRHRNKPCADCHITVPHGGKIPRLIATTSMSGLDTRYSGGSVNMVSINIPVTGGSSCQVSGCGGSHSSSARTYAW